MDRKEMKNGMPGFGVAGRKGRRKATALDPLLVFEWKSPQNDRVVFRGDATFCAGTVGVYYNLELNGMRLNIGNRSYFDRLDGAPNTIVGHWRDAPNGEEFFCRTDGRYIDLTDGDPIVYFGIYRTPAANALDTYEYRGNWSTENDQLAMDSIFGRSETFTYVVNQTALTLYVGGVSISYAKVGPVPF